MPTDWNHFFHLVGQLPYDLYHYLGALHYTRRGMLIAIGIFVVSLSIVIPLCRPRLQKYAWFGTFSDGLDHMTEGDPRLDRSAEGDPNLGSHPHLPAGIERNVETLFRTKEGIVVELNDGHVLAPADGAYVSFGSLIEYRKLLSDRDTWLEVRNPAERKSILEVSVRLRNSADVAHRPSIAVCGWPEKLLVGKGVMIRCK